MIGNSVEKQGEIKTDSSVVKKSRSYLQLKVACQLRGILEDEEETE